MLQFTQRPRGLFGQPKRQPWHTPGYGDGIQQERIEDSAPMGGPVGQNAPQPAQKGKVNWGGVAADFLAGLAGQQGPYMQSLQAEQERAAQARDRAQDRQDRMTDWRQQFDYERANPKPTNNDTVADYDFLRKNLGDDAAKTFLQNKANPPVYRQGPDMQFYRVEPSQSAMPTAPVGKLTPIAGGAVPQASRPFVDAPDPTRAPGRMTSGRRTVEGNALVGGKTNSRHLSGDAADYVGATPAQLRAYFGQGVKIIPEGDHNHVQGIGAGRVPDFGKNGTKGLKR